MRNFIAAVFLAAFAQALAYADDSYAPPETSNAEIEQAASVSAGEETESAESAESAAAGDGAQSDGESAGGEGDAESTRELDV